VQGNAAATDNCNRGAAIQTTARADHAVLQDGTKALHSCAASAADAAAAAAVTCINSAADATLADVAAAAKLQATATTFTTPLERTTHKRNLWAIMQRLHTNPAWSKSNENKMKM
jgi:hypothetical protein